MAESLQQFAEVKYNEITEKINVQDRALHQAIEQVKTRLEETITGWGNERIISLNEDTDQAATRQAARQCLMEAAAAAAAQIAEQANGERLSPEQRHAQAPLGLHSQWEGLQTVITKETLVHKYFK